MHSENGILNENMRKVKSFDWTKIKKIKKREVNSLKPSAISNINPKRWKMAKKNLLNNAIS